MKIPREQASYYGPQDVHARDSLLSSTSSHVNRPPSRDGDRAGEPDDSDAREVFLSARLVRQRYGDASQMWLWRRLNDPKSDFPQPILIGERRYWRLSELVWWERSRAKGPGQRARAKGEV